MAKAESVNCSFEIDIVVMERLYVCALEVVEILGTVHVLENIIFYLPRCTFSWDAIGNRQL